MAETHPYISGAGNVAQMIGHLRKSFPATITSKTVKKLGLAPNNESYLINVLQFIGVIDEKGKKTSEANKVFSHQKDEEFSKSFEALVKKAYSALFDLHGEGSWDLAGDEIVTFFRQSDQTSATIGKRQASTFKILAGLSGHGKLPASRGAKVKKTESQKKKFTKTSAKSKKGAITNSEGNKNIGLTVRIEINLPADGSKETYDNIFKSIKENLINA
jgi:hypothetical protein